MLDDIDDKTVELIHLKLKNVVSHTEIIKWLNNFKSSELHYVIEIALNLTVYTVNEIEEFLEGGFTALFPTIRINQRIIVMPIGEFGKSGSMISYFFQKTDFYKNRTNKSKIILCPNLHNFQFIPRYNYTLVLVDDFVGSGKTIEKYFTKNISIHKSKFEKIYFVGLAGMRDGIAHINTQFDKVQIPKSNIFKRSFSRDSSSFGYRKYSLYRELSYRYGKSLTKASKTNKFPDALGFENCQALVAFAYGSPNNTLPIIWANQNNWNPLIPRYSIDKVNIAKSIRKKLLHELSILNEFGSKNIKNTLFSLEIKKGRKMFTSFTSIDFSIYTIIKLLRNRYMPITICQKLGISYSDYELIIEKGIERGVFDKEGNLTMFGLELYQDAKSSIAKAKKEMIFDREDFYKIKDVKYIPRIFNGKS